LHTMSYFLSFFYHSFRRGFPSPNLTPLPFPHLLPLLSSRDWKADPYRGPGFFCFPCYLQECSHLSPGRAFRPPPFPPELSFLDGFFQASVPPLLALAPRNPFPEVQLFFFFTGVSVFFPSVGLFCVSLKRFPPSPFPGVAAFGSSFLYVFFFFFALPPLFQVSPLFDLFFTVSPHPGDSFKPASVFRFLCWSPPSSHVSFWFSPSVDGSLRVVGFKNTFWFSLCPFSSPRYSLFFLGRFPVCGFPLWC